MSGGTSRSLSYRCLIYSYQNVGVNRSGAESASRINLRANREEVMNVLAAFRRASPALKIQKYPGNIDENVTLHSPL